MTATTTLSWRRGGVLSLACLLLAACGDPLDRPLPGQREALRAGAEEPQIAGAVPTAPAVGFAAARNLTAWTHRASGPAHVSPHVELAAQPQLIWSQPIGVGNTRRSQLTSDPIVVGGRVFALDAANTVSAFATSGAPLWSRNMVPSTENALDGTGGGLGYGGGKLYATNGFGELVAFDPATGGEVWTQDLDAFGGAAPTYFDGRVYLAARDSTAWVLDAEFGRIDWQVSGTPSTSNLTGGPGVAVNEQLAIFPFNSGDVIATFRQGGIRLWNATVLGGRDGRAYAQITDIAADPVIAGDRVYLGTQQGRVVALDLQTGERVWTAPTGALSPPLVAGRGVFVVSDTNRLVRIDRDSGAIVWAIQLPNFRSERARRQAATWNHYGPILAGGRLVVPSDDGNMRFFDPRTGASLGAVAVPGGAASNPVVVDRTLYVLGARGELHAFR
ncbi:MAG: outer membrane protein assembly factor BamB family protein [Shimia sp.]